MAAPKVYLRLVRTFSATTSLRHPGPSFFDLAARSQTAETAYLRRGSKLSPVEFSPNLELLRSESELATGRRHKDLAAQGVKVVGAGKKNSSGTHNGDTRPPSPSKSEAGGVEKNKRGDGISTTPPPAAVADFTAHALPTTTTSPESSAQDALIQALLNKDERIAGLERELKTQRDASASRERTFLVFRIWVTVAFGLSVLFSYSVLNSKFADPAVRKKLREQRLKRKMEAAERGGMLESLAERGGEHYARAMDPARAEPRYVPPVGALGAVAGGEEMVRGEEVSGEMLLREKEEMLVPDMPVVSAAPVPSSVVAWSGEEKTMGKDRKHGGWKSWIWKGE